MDRYGLSAPELARLKRIGRTRRTSAFQAAIAQWRPTRSLRERLRDAGIGFWGGFVQMQRSVPELLESEFLFAVCQWVAVFVVAAVIASTGEIPLHRRYAVGLAALLYLYLGAELARFRRPFPGRTLIAVAADATVAITIYALSAPYVPYGYLLLFFAVARMVERFRDLRALPAALLILFPLGLRHTGPPIGLILEGFGILVLVLGIEHLLTITAQAREEAVQMAALVRLSSAVARAADIDALMGSLVTLAPALLPADGWAFWQRDSATGDYRPERWYGLPSGERPVSFFSPALEPDRNQAVEIVGPMPGTSCGVRTIIQPMVSDGEVVGLISVSGGREISDPALRRLLRQIGEQCAMALRRLQELGDERHRMATMETANRLAGIAATNARDDISALNALAPALCEALRCDSVHLEWVDGDELRLVVPSRDPLFLNGPPRLPLAQTRSSAALPDHSLREPVAGRRPEDMVLAAVGIRHVAVAPFSSGGGQATLQVGRRDPHAFTSSDVILLQMVADRLALVLEAGVFETNRPAITEVAA